MTQFVLDLFFTTVFVILLVLLYKAKDRIFARNRTCYQYTHSGLLTLCAVALIQTAGHQGMLHSVPFLAEDVYRNLIEAIGIVAGVTFMIAGASFWLPGGRQETDTIPDSIHSEIPSNIHASILESQETGEIFTRTFEKICRHYRFAGFALYRNSSTAGKFVCTDCNNLTQARMGELKQESIDPESPVNDLEKIKNQYEFSYVLPIRIDNRIRAAALFTRDIADEISDEERLQLEHICDSISSRLTRKYHSLKNEYYEDCWQNLREITHINIGSGGLKDHLGEIYEVFKKAAGVEFLCMAMYDESRRNFKRYAVGINGNVLLDLSVMPDVKASHFGEILEKRKSLIIDDIGKIEDVAIDSLFMSCSQKSLMAVPVYHGGEIMAIITLGSPKTGAFNLRRQFMAKLLCYAMKPALVVESEKLTRRKTYAHLESLYTLGREPNSFHNSAELYDCVNTHILNSIDTALVRIHQVAPDRKTLHCAMTELRRPMDMEEKDGFRVDNVKTPSYKRTIDEQEIVFLMNDGNNDSSADEEFVIVDLKGMKRAVLIPVVVNGLTTAVITLADMRDDARAVIDTEDLTYLGCIADMIGKYLRIMNMGRLMASRESTSESYEGPRKLKINLKKTPGPDMVNISEMEPGRVAALPLETSFDREIFRESIEESQRNIARLVETAE